MSQHQHPVASRVVNVWASNSGSELGQHGSGYRVDARYVITSRHVVLSNDDCMVRFDHAMQWSNAKVAWRGQGELADVAMLDLGPEFENVELEEPDPVWASGRDVDGTCVAVGYPEFLRFDELGEREQFVGTLRPLAGRGRGRLHAQGNTGSSEAWRGMGGAGLFSQGCLIGVVSHAMKDRLLACPVSELFEDASFVTQFSHIRLSILALCLRQQTHPVASRVVNVWGSNSGSELGRQGSGYRVAARYVITSGHVVPSGDDCMVRFDHAIRWSNAKVAWRGQGELADVAMLDLGPEFENVELEEPDPVWASGRDVDGTCVALGYPEFLRFDEFGEREQFVGTLRPHAGRERRQIHAQGTTDWGEAWRGMAGAGLFSQGCLIGVVSQSMKDRLLACPVSELFEDASFVTQFSRIQLSNGFGPREEALVATENALFANEEAVSIQHERANGGPNATLPDLARDRSAPVESDELVDPSGLEQHPSPPPLDDLKELNELGKGAFAIITKVQRVSDPSSTYALRKHRVLADMTDEVRAWAQERFVSGAKLQQQLAKDFLFVPGVFAIYDEAVPPCMLIELVEFTPNPESLEIRLRIVRNVADAVRALHQRGVVHRDLRPSNIAHSRQGDKIFLLDYDLAYTREMSLTFRQKDVVLSGLLRSPFFPPEFREHYTGTGGTDTVLLLRDRAVDVYMVCGLIYWAVMDVDPPSNPVRAHAQIKSANHKKLRKAVGAAHADRILQCCLRGLQVHIRDTPDSIDFVIAALRDDKPAAWQRILYYAFGRPIETHDDFWAAYGPGVVQSQLTRILPRILGLVLAVGGAWLLHMSLGVEAVVSLTWSTALGAGYLVCVALISLASHRILSGVPQWVSLCHHLLHLLWLSGFVLTVHAFVSIPWRLQMPWETAVDHQFMELSQSTSSNDFSIDDSKKTAQDHAAIPSTTSEREDASSTHELIPGLRFGGITGEHYLLWGPTDLNTTWVTVAPDGAVSITGRCPGLLVAAGGVLWRIEIDNHKPLMLHCEIEETEPRTVQHMTDSTMTAHRIDHDGIRRSLIGAATAEIDTGGEVVWGHNISVLGAGGGLVFIDSLLTTFGCGAHEYRTGRFSIVDLNTSTEAPLAEYLGDGEGTGVTVTDAFLIESERQILRTWAGSHSTPSDITGYEESDMGFYMPPTNVAYFPRFETTGPIWMGRVAWGVSYADSRGRWDSYAWAEDYLIERWTPIRAVGWPQEVLANIARQVGPYRGWSRVSGPIAEASLSSSCTMPPP